LRRGLSKQEASLRKIGKAAHVRRGAGDHNSHAPHLSMLIETYATSVVIGSRIDGSSFSGLLTRVEIGHMRIKMLISKLDFAAVQLTARFS
jgi:hypothetical protein